MTPTNRPDRALIQDALLEAMAADIPLETKTDIVARLRAVLDGLCGDARCERGCRLAMNCRWIGPKW